MISGRVGFERCFSLFDLRLYDITKLSLGRQKLHMDFFVPMDKKRADPQEASTPGLGDAMAPSGSRGFYPSHA